ncbi:MAG: NUDIX hydrolase [Acidimicrobiia bacterium]
MYVAWDGATPDEGIGFPIDQRRTDPEAAMECSIHRLVADVALHAGDRVMLVKYEDTSKYDGQPGWFLPDDPLGHLEHPADAAARIVRQQLGIEPPALELGEIESLGNGTWHLIFHFTGRLSESSEPHFGANLAAAQWFPCTGLPEASDVAHHGWPLEVLDRLAPTTGPSA